LTHIDPITEVTLIPVQDSMMPKQFNYNCYLFADLQEVTEDKH